MRALKVFLFITFLIFAIFGVVGLLFPTLLAGAGIGPPEPYGRIISTSVVAFALALWFAFRDPQKNTAIIMAAIVWLGLEGLVLLIDGIAGTLPWAQIIFGVIVDWVLAVLLVIFYPRGEKAS